MQESGSFVADWHHVQEQNPELKSRTQFDPAQNRDATTGALKSEQL
jgi:hypothetical protein